ncbi:NosD domain-containing protein [Chloroflexota bacterium]
MNNFGLLQKVFFPILICGLLTTCITPQASSTPIQSSTKITQTQLPAGKTIIVTSVEDSGPGTLRQALLDANPGDSINFDTSVFSPDQPTIIYLQSQLTVERGSLIIDADQAGIILDGSKILDGSGTIIQFVSNGNTISGLLMRNVQSMAINIKDGQNNIIRDNIIGGSDYGISIVGEASSNNTITGNYIGVLSDGVTPISNRVAGIAISSGAHDNQIGPNNHIAFNSDNGISINGRDAIRNTIFHNSIHDNGIYGGIGIYDNYYFLSAPIIFDFNLEDGTVVGSACVLCAVEIFSDSGNEGAIYEGQAIADDNGMFNLDKDTSFAGPFLTAIATDASGTSSEFSQHTFGSGRSLSFQDGNDLPKTAIALKPYPELMDNRISDQKPVLGEADVFARLWEVERSGLKWMKLSFDDIELQFARDLGVYSKFEIFDFQEKTISLLAENGTTIVYILVYWDEILHADKYPDYKNEKEVQLFLDYTRMIVSHFKGRIQYYEILNEGLVYVDIEDYINLIHRVIPVIREVDPEAKIVVGGATDLRLTYSLDYLFGVLQSDVMPLVDVIGFHPMYGASPQLDETKEYYYNYPALVQEIKDTATAHGFKGEYFAGELIWRTPATPHPSEPGQYTDTVAAKYYARAIVMNLGMDIIAGPLGAEIIFISRAIQNLSNVMPGAEPTDLVIEILSEATNFRSYSFSMPNGDKLIALWTDGVAADYDPGVLSTLILPGLADLMATGIDVLYGYEQELISSNENGDLVIHDFMLKDYPIFIRLSN